MTLEVSEEDRTESRLLIRPYVDSDRSAIEGMAQEVVDDGTRFVYDNVPGVMGYWLGTDTTTYVAEMDGEVIGTYAVKPNYVGNGSHVANAGYMVRTNNRCRGIGGRLCEHSIETARKLGYVAMQFNMVVGTNVSAHTVFARHGFRVVGVLPGAFRLPSGERVDSKVLFCEL